MGWKVAGKQSKTGEYKYRRQAYAFKRGSQGEVGGNSSGAGGPLEALLSIILWLLFSGIVNAIRYRGQWELHFEDQRRDKKATFYMKRSELEATFKREAPDFFDDGELPKLQIWA